MSRLTRPRTVPRLLCSAVAVAVAVGSLLAGSPAYAANPKTPGDFTGYGFDQCLAPTQHDMDRWLNFSPFLAVGIYISGDSRACRNQPNLTPAWVSTQLAKGWRLLPITLGPQASCQPRFPRYRTDKTIDPTPGTKGTYPNARAQARAEARKTAAAAQALGITTGSTLWYDLEGFDSTKTRCRESALRFLSAYTRTMHKLDYVSGVYSSAGSGIKMLDDARVLRPGVFTLPDAIWIARWDGAANTSTSYIRSDGWLPGGRMKQYQGGHDETWGRVRINIDRNYLDLGQGSVAAKENHCDGTRVSFRDYPPLTADVPRVRKVTALKCLLSEQGAFNGAPNGVYGNSLVKAIAAWQSAHRLPVSETWSRRAWMTLLAAGDRDVVKVGSAGGDVRRVQRALNADGAKVKVTGVFDASTDAAVRAWQRSADLAVSGVVSARQWKSLQAGVTG